MSRLFLGIGLEDEVSARIHRPVREALGNAADIPVYAPGDLHLTLAFLGEVDVATIPLLQEIATEEFRGLIAPELRIGTSSGAFPSVEEPRALWLEVSETFESYGRLGVLRNRACQVGFAQGWRPNRAERERPFRPHITVARPKNGATVPAEFFEIDVERAWLPVDVTLFESQVNRGQPGSDRYRAIASWPLVVRPG